MSVSNVSHQGGPSQKIGPILVNFEHAGVTPEAALEQFQAKLSYTFPDTTKVRKSRPELDLSLQTDHIKYSNKAPSVQGIRPSPYLSTYLAIKNKITGQIRLVETNSVTVGALVKTPKTTNLQLLNEEEVGEGTRTKKKKHLVKEFGATRGQRVYEQADRMTVDQGQLEAKLGEAAGKVEEAHIEIPEVEDDTITRMIPPCNRQTKNLIDVYKLEDILSDEQREVLSESAQNVLDSFSDISDLDIAMRFSPLVGQIIRDQFHKPDVEFVGVALYIQGLVTLMYARPQMLRQGLKCLPPFLPNAIKTHIFKTFTENNQMSPSSRDKVICYIIVLSLLISNFSVKLLALSKSINKKADVLKQLIHATGATIVKDDEERHSVSLKFPLTSFEAARPSGRRKRRTM
ncbi:hypothetical protein TCAL_11915 [Tigriopus californicus]|uniref:Uncharacterized protein n=1 Tax=Tigriopus californicus TaxID=6832 RepID=A0A553PPV5_TIGCA|nr:hypothetical protein TCAL_11915 [Tigriopus californicus]